MSKPATGAKEHLTCCNVCMLCGSAEQGNLHFVPGTAPAACAGSLSDLASEMRLVPEPENPFAHHPTPMQTARKLQATGRTQDAALAFEAAGVVGFSSHSILMHGRAPFIKHRIVMESKVAFAMVTPLSGSDAVHNFSICLSMVICP